MDDLIACLVLHEGAKRYAYPDSLGNISIGIGRNIDKKGGRGLSLDEQMYLLNNDIIMCRTQLKSMPFYQIQDDVRKDALVEMCFNLGFSNLLGFKNMISDLDEKLYISAVRCARESKWATQISSSRLDNICYRLLHGAYP
jgi:lysozyme